MDFKGLKQKKLSALTVKLESHLFTSWSARRSCQVMRLWKCWPVVLLQVIKVHRWVEIPMQVTSEARRLASVLYHMFIYLHTNLKVISCQLRRTEKN
jgi:hypothetical protein